MPSLAKSNLFIYIPDTCALIFSSSPFLQFILTATCNCIPERGFTRAWKDKERWVKQKIAVLNSIIYICTRALHSFFTLAPCRAASVVIPLPPKATITPFIQPNLSLLRSRHYQHPSSHTVLLYSLHVRKPSRYSLIHSTRKFPS